MGSSRGLRFGLWDKMRNLKKAVLEFQGWEVAGLPSAD
jgi:hypothetical protein